jgi:outer membrane protein insertion porin family
MKTCHYLLSPLLLLCFVPAFLASQNMNAQISTMPIASIIFEGNKSIGQLQLRKQLRRTVQGGLYTSENLQADLTRLEEAYQDEGFLRVKIGPPDVQIRAFEAGKGVAIRIPIEEGARFTSGKVFVKNAKVLEPDALIQMYPLKKGQPYSRTQIARWQGKITEAYSSLGHIRVRCDAQESLNAVEKTVDCTLDCSEGAAYRVGKITLAGDKSIDRSKFVRRLLLSEGGIFNPENLALSVQFLNQAGLYKPISNSDIDLEIDEKRGTVDLTFRLFAVDP